MHRLRFTTLVDAPSTVAFDVARTLGRPWPMPLEEILSVRPERDVYAVGPGSGWRWLTHSRRFTPTGAGTLVDELLRRVGLRNLAATLGKPALSRIGLEELARAQPDYLVVETETDRISDQGTEMLHHPVLASIPRIRLPQSWTVCGGPAYVRAARSIAAQLR